MVNLIGKKDEITNNKTLLAEYQNRYDCNETNWYTDGGCRNVGKSNVIASYAIYQKELDINLAGII